MPALGKSAPKAAKKKRADAEFKKFSEGKLHSGSKNGPVVKNPKQATAIALSESGQSSKPRTQPKSTKAKAPTDAQRSDYMAVNTANKKRRKRNIGRS